MSLWKLWLSVLGTLVIIIGASNAFFKVLLGYFGSLNLILLVTLVASLNIIQWLLAPPPDKRPVQGEGGEGKRFPQTVLRA